MLARSPFILLILLLLVLPAHAADHAVGDLIGTWTVTGPDVGGKVTMEFAAPNQLTVVRIDHSKNGNERSQGLGPDWKLAGRKLTFTGSMSTNEFEIKGVWTLAWDGPDKLTATAAKGKKYQLERVTAGGAADNSTDKPAEKAAGKPGANVAAGDLPGTWAISGPGLDGFKATLEFVKPDTLLLVRISASKNSDAHSQSTGPTWTLRGNTIAFHGSLAADNFKIKGDWAVAWDGPDKFTATTGKGKVYHLERVKAK